MSQPMTGETPTPGQLRDALLRFLVPRVPDLATAEDLVHDIFVRAAKQEHKLRNRDAYVGWLFRIARNRLIDYYRTHRPSELLEEKHFPSEDPGTPTAEEDRLREDLARYIRGVIRQLPPIYRDALLATEFEGLTQVELARRLDLGLPAVKSRVQRARALVKAEIERCCQWETDIYGGVTDCRRRPTSPCDCQNAD